MNVDIRLARTSDATCLGLLSRDLIEFGLAWSWTPARVARNIRSPDTVVLAACNRRCICGFAIMCFAEADANLSLLGVRPKYQRRGIASRLLAWLEKSARTAGIGRVHVELRATNEGALNFYRERGFRLVARLPRYYGGVETAIRMAHLLGTESVSNR